MQVVENKGARIPVLGLGTMRLQDETCIRIVSEALNQGYRHIDTAQMYGNEAAVGKGLREGLKASKISREQIFVTTKVWWDKFAPGDLENSVEESLKKLDLRYVDLLLLHWPNPKVPYVDTLNSLAKVKRAGLAKHIGVANNTVALLTQAVQLSPEPLVNNQIEVHPFLDQRKILAACAQNDVSVTAYCPIGRGNIANPTLDRIGAGHGKTAAQISLRWLVQQGLIVIPGTSKEERLKENAAIFDFTLTDAEMTEIGTLAQPDGRIVSPPFAPKWDI